MPKQASVQIDFQGNSHFYQAAKHTRDRRAGFAGHMSADMSSEALAEAEVLAKTESSEPIYFRRILWRYN